MNAPLLPCVGCGWRTGQRCPECGAPTCGRAVQVCGNVDGLCGMCAAVELIGDELFRPVEPIRTMDSYVVYRYGQDADSQPMQERAVVGAVDASSPACAHEEACRLFPCMRHQWLAVVPFAEADPDDVIAALSAAIPF